MAMQQYFGRLWKTRKGKVTNYQTSGREIDAEVCVRNKGKSICLVRVSGIAHDEVNFTNIIVTDPETGEVILDKSFRTEP